MNPAIYRHSRVLAAPSQRATPDEALMLARLADKALATAAEFGVACDRREALARARHNLAYVRAVAGSQGGVKESEWLP